MAALIPHPPYTAEELQRLYPSQLQLEQVQIVLRHGERTPVSARFQNAGLPTHWPYCQHAARFKDIIAASIGQGSEGKNKEWDTMTFRRVLETFDADDSPVAAKGRNGEVDGICQPGELTTTGRTTTRALGTRLRHLYINQLHFLPDTLTSAHDVTLRSTPIQRALESVQQTYTGLYPPTKRASTLPNPTIVARAMGEETLFPNTGACKRFAELFEAFADRAAKRWNGSEELAYINSKIGKWMPLEGTQPGRVRVDGKPRLSGVMDTINASKAHGETTRLPKEFYDEQVLKNIDKIACDEWYDGFRESLEYRKLGMGALMGDMCTRMVWHAERIVRDEQSSSSAGTVEDEDTTRADPKLLLAGAHDTTLAGILASLGAFGGGSWPPFTSHVAIELFSTKPSSSASTSTPTSVKSWWNSLSPFTSSSSSASSIAKKPTSDSTPSDRAILKDHYVRIRYNDVPALIPGCAKPGRHLEGDKSFCTLEAFKAIVEDVAPKNWKRECRMNLGQSAIPEKVERAGYVVGDAELEE